jgi:hypothetical protein
VGIAGLVGDLVMKPVCSHPEDGSAFESEGAAHHQEILKPPGALESAMGEQAMVAEADPKTAGQPVQEESGKECGPCKHEERGNRADVECDHERRGDPIHPSALPDHETSWDF